MQKAGKNHEKTKIFQWICKEFAPKIGVKLPRFWYFGDFGDFGIWSEFAPRIGVKLPRFWYFGDVWQFWNLV